MMEKTIEKGVESVDSSLTTFERIMEKLNRIEELLAIQSRKMKPSPIPCSQYSVKSVTLHPPPVSVMTPPPPHPVSIMTPPPPPPVSATSLPPQPPVSLTPPPPMPLVSMETPTSVIETVVVAPSNILVASLPTRTSSLSRVAPLSTRVDPLSTKTLALTRIYASLAHRDWKELSQLTKEFLTTINLGRIYKASPGITVQQGEYEYPNQIA
ncbi:proline-rich receptor-like protein kinase PERK2 [Salvia miltiorrhiza]|uniref:proline-rich receptor-like protein kinase PERK2 n=1 Tax=Salvia miltiorrhiza TaxID=226208 RepID=UPI0025ABD6FF|nr:proline-rich receptor-like protein kinase PERK2 [Salvia miltiorrhiza]